jgi:hypothetical protein
MAFAEVPPLFAPRLLALGRLSRRIGIAMDNQSIELQPVRLQAIARRLLVGLQPLGHDRVLGVDVCRGSSGIAERQGRAAIGGEGHAKALRVTEFAQPLASIGLVGDDQEVEQFRVRMCGLVHRANDGESTP